MSRKTNILNRIIENLQRFMPQKQAPSTMDCAPELSVDTGRPMRTGYRVLGFGLGLFLVWAAFAPLDEGVPAPGTVMLDTKRKAVQHQQGGIVSEVLVGEGQMVQEGDTLIRLDAANMRANFESVKQNYMAFRAQEGRLLAEQLDQSDINFHPDLISAADDPFVKQHMDNQLSLFHARRSGRKAEINAINESILGQQAILQSLRDVLPYRQEQLQLLFTELQGIKDLVSEGYAPRNRQSELERQHAEISANLADLHGNIARNTNTVAELRLRAVQRQQEFRQEVGSQLAEVRRQVEADGERLRAVSAELARTEIKAPTTGQVVGLNIQTVGGVVQPYQTLMDIVPENEVLLLEVNVPPHLIDRISLDDVVDVRFNNFSHSPQLVVEGKLVSISQDLLSDPRGQIPPYYLARVVLTKTGMEQLSSRVMQPGMPAEVLIKTGRRSLLTYLLHPLVKRIASSLTEE